MISPDNGQSEILLLAREVQDAEASISSLIRNRWYVHKDTNLLALSDALGSKPEVPAVGVVDDLGKVFGVIVRRELVDLLGRPFGIDVMKKEQVLRAAETPPSFYYDTNILAVSESLDSLDDSEGVRYYPVKTENGEYLGLFSSQDLLYYLSRQSQLDSGLARSIQKRISAGSFDLSVGSFELAGTTSRVKGIGGDFQFVHHVPHGRIWLGMADIRGKGIAPALISASLWGAVRSFDFNKGIGRFIRELNSLLHAGFDFDKDIRGVFLELDSSGDSLLSADMHHGRTFILRGNLLLRMKAANSNTSLGHTKELKPTLSRYTLEPGDLVILVSDGAIEQTNAMGETYGLFRLKEVLAENTEEPVREIADRLMTSFTSFRKDKALADDAAFVLIRYRPQAT